MAFRRENTQLEIHEKVISFSRKSELIAPQFLVSCSVLFKLAVGASFRRFVLLNYLPFVRKHSVEHQVHKMIIKPLSVFDDAFVGEM